MFGAISSLFNWYFHGYICFIDRNDFMLCSYQYNDRLSSFEHLLSKRFNHDIDNLKSCLFLGFTTPFSSEFELGSTTVVLMLMLY